MSPSVEPAACNLQSFSLCVNGFRIRRSAIFTGALAGRFGIIRSIAPYASQWSVVACPFVSDSASDSSSDSAGLNLVSLSDRLYQSLVQLFRWLHSRVIPASHPNALIWSIAHECHSSCLALNSVNGSVLKFQTLHTPDMQKNGRLPQAEWFRLCVQIHAVLWIFDRARHLDSLSYHV